MMTTSDNKIAVPPGQRPPSPVGMLLWKEWRQQRWLFAALAAMPIFLTLFTMLFTKNSEVPLALIWLVVLPATLLLLSANGFCGEEDDGSAAFAEMLPLRKTTIFGLKLAMVWALTLTVVLVAAGAHTLSASGREFLPKIIESSSEAWFYVAAFVIMLPALCAIVSTVARRTITCIATTLLLGALVMGWMFLIVTLVAAMMADWAYILVAFLGAVSSAVYLGARLRCRFRGAAIGRRVVAVGAALVIICMVTVTPLFGLWAHYIYMKMPEDYLDTCKGQCSATHIVPGSHELVIVGQDYKIHSARIGMIDLDTGKSRWVDRFAQGKFFDHASGSASASYCSPDGKRFIVYFSNRWAGPPQLIPHIVRELFRFKLFGRLYPKHEPWVVESDTLRKTRLSDIAQGLKQVRPSAVLGWVGNSLLAVMTHDRILFVDVTTGKVTERPFPRDLLHRTQGRDAPFALSSWCWTRANRVIVPSGAYEGAQGIVNAPWLIYSPDLEEPRRTQINYDRAYWVSPDGQWMFYHLYVASLETGDVFDISSQEGYPRFTYADSEYTCRVHGFTGDNKYLILSQKNTVVLFNLKTHKTLEIVFDQASSSKLYWQYVVISGSPDGRRLLIMGYSGSAIQKAVVLDLEAGEQTVIWNIGKGDDTFYFNTNSRINNRYWLDNERILLKHNGNLVIVNADGSGRRYVFPRKEIDPGKVQIAR